MGSGACLAASAADIAWASFGVGIGAECQGQEVVHETLLAGACRAVDEQRPPQAPLSSRLLGHAPRRRLPEALESSLHRVDHATEYRFGAHSEI